MSNNFENTFTTREIDFRDSTVLDLSPSTAEDHRRNGTFQSTFQKNVEISATASMIAKPRPSYASQSRSGIDIDSGDTTHGVIIDHDLFTATLNVTTDGLSSASPLWIGRIPLLKNLIHEIATHDRNFDHQLLDSLPWEYPDLASAALIEDYYLSPSWMLSLGKLITQITSAIRNDSSIRRSDDRHPYPHLELVQDDILKQSIIDYGEFRNDRLASLPSMLSSMEVDQQKNAIPHNIFNWYLNAIFSHSISVVPKRPRNSHESKMIVSSSITSNADTLDILMPDRPMIKMVLYKEQYIRLNDQNRHVEQMIASLSKRYAPNSRKKEALLLAKPQTVYMTYPSKSSLGWLRDYSTCSVPWSEKSDDRYGAPQMTQASMTDGAIYNTRDLGRNLSESEFVYQVEKVLEGQTPDSITDDASHFIFKLKVL